MTDDEIVDALRTSPPPEFPKIPEFQTDSQFDLAKYQRWLTSSVAQQYMPSLEAQYRDQLQRSKLLRVVTADIYLSDAALWDQYRDENEKVKIDLTAIVSAEGGAGFDGPAERCRDQRVLQGPSQRLLPPGHRVSQLRGPAPPHDRRGYGRGAGSGGFGARGDRGRRAVRGRGPARVERQRQRVARRRSRRVDPRQHGCGVRLGGVRHAAQHGVAAGALVLRLSPDRDDQPEG